MKRALALVVTALPLAACLFPDLGALSTGDAAVDASTNDVSTGTDSAAGDASTRIKNITFENGLIVDPIFGASAADYPVALVDAGSLMGAFSVKTLLSSPDASNPTSSVIQDFTAPQKFYASMLLRLGTEPTTTTRFFKVGNNQTTIEVSIVPAAGGMFMFRLRVRLTTTGSTDKLIGDSPQFPLGQTVRFGLEAFQQSSAGTDGVVSGYASLGTADFQAPFATSAQETLLGPSDEVVVGASTGQFIDMTFDDIRLDSAQMPEP